MYRIERQDQLYKTLPQAVFFSPTIVVFTVLNLLLPLSAVFAPGSLTVDTKNVTNVSEPCIIPSGNISTPNTPDSLSLFSYSEGPVWGGATPKAMDLATQCLVEQRIPDLPQACGPNCRYNVSVPSFVIQCTPNPSYLPYNQMAGGMTYVGGNTTVPELFIGTLWNATIDPASYDTGFFVGWQSSGPNGGTSGNGTCIPLVAQYDVEVRKISLSTRLFLIIDSRSRRREVFNLLRCPSCKIVLLPSRFLMCWVWIPRSIVCSFHLSTMQRGHCSLAIWLIMQAL